MQHWSLGKILTGVAAGLLALCVLVYVADWIVLRIRAHRGSAYGSIVVQETDVVREKGNRLEYYSNPPQPTPCVYALFPHEGQPACWWLVRHADQEHYLN